ncbi:hypothetical protein ACH4CE_34740 [Streptomyces gelaticus]|uniref:hypothetical protein n=1 Tax=Streptomyces gelaticus TaxID=285446 RepID=UPI0037AEFE9B
MHQLGSAQAGVGGVVQLQDPPLPQPGLVAGDEMGDGDGVQEAEAAQQPAGEPGRLAPGEFVGERLALVFPQPFVGGPGVTGEPAGLAPVGVDLLGEGGFGLVEGEAADRCRRASL